MKLTKQALQEQKDYRLLEDSNYIAALAREERMMLQNFKKFGHYNSMPRWDTRSMVKALRMFAWQNSPEDWARLHISEAALCAERRKIWGLN